jgi:DNA-binding transcriptional MerR regulator
MRIGELAERTGVPARLLRYYEEQGLLTPARAANGYRDYGEPLVDRVAQIRGLLGVCGRPGASGRASPGRGPSGGR